MLSHKCGFQNRSLQSLSFKTIAFESSGFKSRSMRAPHRHERVQIKMFQLAPCAKGRLSNNSLNEKKSIQIICLEFGTLLPCKYIGRFEPRLQPSHGAPYISRPRFPCSTWRAGNKPKESFSTIGCSGTT